jgi:hypothetical protein
VLVITLAVIAILAIFTAIRNKNIGCGVLVFLALSIFFTLAIAGIELLQWYGQNISVIVQTRIGFITEILGFIALNPFIMRPNRMVKAGNIIPPGILPHVTGWQILALLLVLHCILTMASAAIVNTNIGDVARQNTLWWILALLVAIGTFFSFEFREKGMVHRGRVILFSDIEHAEWEDWKNKTKLKIRLKNKGREYTIKIPRKFVTPVDNYVRANFPHP